MITLLNILKRSYRYLVLSTNIYCLFIVVELQQIRRIISVSITRMLTVELIHMEVFVIVISRYAFLWSA